MTEKYDLSRRKVLAGLGTIGVAGVGAGLGTSALFTDEETFTNNQLTAGELDLIVDYATEIDQGDYNHNIVEGRVNGDGAAVYSYVIEDLKPGDEGVLVFCPKIVDNPAWLWVGSPDGVTNYENGQTEPEELVDSTGGDPGEGNGELGDKIEATISYASGYTTDTDPDEDGDDDIVCQNKTEIDSQTLNALFADLETGFQVDGDLETGGKDPYPASSMEEEVIPQVGPCLCIEWVLPASVGNEIQTDSVEFSFVFYAEQSRNNPNPSAPNFGNL